MTSNLKGGGFFFWAFFFFLNRRFLNKCFLSAAKSGNKYPKEMLTEVFFSTNFYPK